MRGLTNTFDYRLRRRGRPVDKRPDRGVRLRTIAVPRLGRVLFGVLLGTSDALRITSPLSFSVPYFQAFGCGLNTYYPSHRPHRSSASVPPSLYSCSVQIFPEASQRTTTYAAMIDGCGRLGVLFGTSLCLRPARLSRLWLFLRSSALGMTTSGPLIYLTDPNRVHLGFWISNLVAARRKTRYRLSRTIT